MTDLELSASLMFTERPIIFSAPILQRLRGLDAAAFLRYATVHGWRVEVSR